MSLQLIYDLTNENADRIVAMLKSLENKIWERVVKDKPEWTDYQIAKEVIRRRLIINLRRHEAESAGSNARDSVQEDNGAIT